MIDELSKERVIDCTLAVVEMCNLVFPEVTNETRPLCRQYQGQVVGPLLQLIELPSKRTAEVIERVGRFLLDDGKLRESEQLFLKAVKIREQLSPNEDAHMVDANVYLCRSYQQQGRFDEAAERLARVLASSKRLLGEDHLATLRAMSTLGYIYRHQGQWQNAVGLQERVVASAKRLLGEEHPDTLEAMSYLGLTYWDQGQWHPAAELQKLILSSSKKVLRRDHPDTLKAKNNLAVTYRKQGQWDDAAELHEDVLSSRTRLFGEDHPETLRAMTNLAITYRSQGRWTETVELHEKTVTSRRGCSEKIILIR